MFVECVIVIELFLNSQHQLESAATFRMIDVYVALLPLPRQIAALILCAVVSGAMFALWRRLPDDDRARVWKHYGWFTGLTCVGCCIAVVSYASWAMFLFHYFASAVSAIFGSSSADIEAAYASAQVSSYSR